MIQTEGSNICRIDIFLMNIFILFMKLSCSSKKNLNFHIHLFACWVIAGLIVLSGNISKKILTLTGDLSSYHFSLQSTLQMIQNILMAQLSESKLEIIFFCGCSISIPPSDFVICVSVCVVVGYHDRDRDWIGPFVCGTGVLHERPSPVWASHSEFISDN